MNPAALASHDAVEPLPAALQVGVWRVEPDLNRITRGDGVVMLEPKAMAMLVTLARRPGQVASRDELLAAVWPGVVVGDNALTQVVTKLRKALGDTAHEPAYIEAIPKKGYRLIAEVRRLPPRAALASVRSPRPGGHRARVAGALFAIALLAAFGAWLSRHEAPAPPAAAAGDGMPTVVVRPFRELDPDPRQDAMARAIGADLVADLSKLAGLRVIDGGAADTHARYALDGTVQHDGDRLRLTVRLDDAADGRTLWSARYDRRVQDLFGVQDELVKSIVQALPVQLSEDQTRRLARRNTRNLQAWERFVHAQAALGVRRPAANDEARASYWEAIRLDPAFARAYAGLALTYALEYQQGWAKDGSAALARAFELAETSIKMDPAMPEARWVQAFVHTQRREHEAALRDLDEALRLNPSYADAYALRGGILTYLGRPADGLPALRQALRLNPEGGSLYFLLLGRAYFFLGDLEQAQVNLAYAVERNAESLETHLYLAATDGLQGHAEGARWQADEIRTLDPGLRIDTWLATYPMTDAPERDRLRSALLATGLQAH